MIKKKFIFKEIEANGFRIKNKKNFLTCLKLMLKEEIVN